MAIGRLRHGERNLISDVPGVLVGHVSVDDGDCHTGVTVVMPPRRNPFTEKLTAAAQVFNGFGKTLGLVQVEELGTLETPIALTATLNVGKVHDAIVTYMADICRRDGVRLAMRRAQWYNVETAGCGARGALAGSGGFGTL